MAVTPTQYDGQSALLYDTLALQLTIVPQIGGKVVSVIDRTTGRQILWKQPGRSLRPALYGGMFADYDISGWDECFPTIGPCPYPADPWRTTPIPDHGELWTAPWTAREDGEDLVMQATGVRFPYVFERRFHPQMDGLQILYAATNTGSAPLQYLWSIHPFLAVTPTMRILLPDGATIYVDSSADARLGKPGARHSWPLTHDSAGHPVDLGLMGSPDQETIEKLYALDLTAGWAAVIDEATGDYVAYTFDRRELPVVGLAINRGAWPVEGERGFSLLIEPCAGWPDLLTEAVTSGLSQVLPARSTVRWWVTLHVGRGQERLRTVIREDNN